MKHGTRTSADYTSAFNKFKAEIAKTPTPPAPEFRPLKSWPIAAHPRQSEMDAFRTMPSQYT